MKKQKVYLAWLSTGERRDEHLFLYKRLQEKYSDRLELVLPERSTFLVWHDFARNMAVESFLASDCDILWFLDSDVIPPSNILDLITEHGEKWKLAGAPYPVFMSVPGYRTQQVVYCVYSKREGADDILDPARIPDMGADFIDGIATGCLFIRREILEGLEKPYFEHIFDKETRHLDQGEDLGFCKRMMKAGNRFFIDYSMRCQHIKKVDLISVSDTIEEQKRMVLEAYSKEIRNKMTLQKLAKLREPNKSNLILPK